MSDKYYIEGNHLRGYAILDSHGGIEYDLLETRTEAEEICEVLNSGIGPDWDSVSRTQLGRKVES